MSQCTLVYAFYDGAKPVQGIKSLPAADCEPEPGGLVSLSPCPNPSPSPSPNPNPNPNPNPSPSPNRNPNPNPNPNPHPNQARALFSLRRQFLHIDPSPSLQLIVELQQVLAPPDAPGKPPKTTSLGWTSLDLFSAQRALNAG